jgi:hypothetical protein
MKSLIIGFVVLAAAAAAILPAGLGWGPDVLLFLRGCVPVLAILVGLILLFVGAADLKDLYDAKKEEKPSE